MEECVIPFENTSGVRGFENSNQIIELTKEILMQVRSVVDNNSTLSVPLAELATLGAGISSLLPAFNKVTQTITMNGTGLYQLANESVGDVLKKAKNGNYWGAFKTAEGSSKFVQLQAAEPMSASMTSVSAVNPALMLMAVALFSIERELKQIAEMEKEIISFLEIEKEAEIEADVETLMGIITKYKYNWGNEHFIVNNHKLVIDIQRTARKNMNSYQKKVNGILKKNQIIIAQSKVNSALSDLEKKFQYYRLSLYTFSFASLIEIMLSRNFKEEYVSDVRDEIRRLSDLYRQLFSDCSIHLEK